MPTVLQVSELGQPVSPAVPSGGKEPPCDCAELNSTFQKFSAPGTMRASGSSTTNGLNVKGQGSHQGLHAPAYVDSSAPEAPNTRRIEQ